MLLCHAFTGDALAWGGFVAVLMMIALPELSAPTMENGATAVYGTPPAGGQTSDGRQHEQDVKPKDQTPTCDVNKRAAEQQPSNIRCAENSTREGPWLDERHERLDQRCRSHSIDRTAAGCGYGRSLSASQRNRRGALGGAAVVDGKSREASGKVRSALLAVLWRVLLSVEHMSNADLCDRNRGLTNAGVRLGYQFP
jgi:Lipid A 3-O-deacylase (PagL)